MLQAAKAIDEDLYGPPERPSCLNGNSFVHPDVQCPPKRRGRKPGTKNTTKEEPQERVTCRPSAAACGFSTVGMSDAEVMEKINKTKRSRKDKKGNEDDQITPEEPKTLPEKKARKKQSSSKKDAEADMKTNRKRKSKDGFGGDGSGDKPDCGTPDTTAAEKKPRNTGKPHGSKRAVEDASDPAPKSKAKRTKAPACETPEHAACEHVADTAPKSRAKRSKAKACEGGPPPPPPPGTPAPVDAREDPKKRASRKSSAYHCARAKAKKAGASEAEQIAAGKAVSCLN